jgi:hypothetical protein
MADKNIEILLKAQRLSFVNVFEPQEFRDEEKGTVRWTRNLNVLVPKKLEDGSTNPLVKVLNDAVKQAIENTWPGQDKKIPAERRCLRDGEPKDPDDETKRYPLYEGYAGHYFISANKPVKSKDAPNNVKVLGPRKTAKNAEGKPCFPVLKESDGLIYSGCYADVIIRIYGYDGKKDKNPDRVNASLEAVKFVRHGEAFGAKAVDAESAFDEEDGDDAFEGGGSASDDDDIG